MTEKRTGEDNNGQQIPPQPPKKNEEGQDKNPKSAQKPKLDVNKNKKTWENIFNSVEDPNPAPESIPETIKMKNKEGGDKSGARPGRNDMFTRNAMSGNDKAWTVHPLVEFRNPIIVKPTSDKYDPRILFITPYTTIKQQGSTIDLYYCVIENHMSSDNEIFNFSILSSGELKDLFGIDLHHNSPNALSHATDKVYDNLDKLVELKKTINDEKIIKSVVKEILKG